MIVPLAASSAVVPAVIAAFGALASASLMAWVALRAQSAEHLLEQIRKAIEEELDDQRRAAMVDDRVKRALRDVLGEDPRNRRWYDQP